METADTSIFLQFAKFSKGFRISDFDDFVQKYIGVENLEFFGRLAYPNQWQMRLSNPKIREDLIRMGKTRINNRSCWLYPLNQQEIRGFVHWLPNSVTNDQLMEQLKQYGDVLLLESQERTIEEQKVESDPRYFCIMLPHGATKEALPHFLKINGFLCHLAIRGRVPACFHCKEVGHRRTECSKYKVKLMNYCNRHPNTAQPRLKPRGRRYVKAETEAENQTWGKEDSSNAETVSLERDVPVDEEATKTQLLLDSENKERPSGAQKEIISKTGNQLAEIDIFTEQIAKSCIDISTVLCTETESQGLVEVIQKIQQRTVNDISERLQNFAREIVLVLTAGTFPTNTADQMKSAVSKSMDASLNLEQKTTNEELEKQAMEVSTPKEHFITFEIADVSKIDTNLEERKEEISALQKVHEVKDGKEENPEKMIKKTEEVAGEDNIPNLSGVLKSVVLILEQTKQDASMKIQSSFKKLVEEIVSFVQAEIPLIESSIDKQQKQDKSVMQSELIMLEQAKQIALDNFECTFKKLEEKVESLLIQMETEQIVTNKKVTKGDLDFAFKILKQTKENVKGTLLNTFSKLLRMFEKEAEPVAINTEISAESRPSSEGTKSSTKSIANLEQFKQEALAIVKQFDQDELKVTVEKSELITTADKQHKETILPGSDTKDVAEDQFKDDGKISESTEGRDRENKAERFAINTEISVESRPSSEGSESSTNSAANLKQFKQEAFTIAKQFDQDEVKVAVTVENSEKKTVVNKKDKETILSGSETGAVAQDNFKDSAKISESIEETVREVGIKTDFVSEKSITLVPEGTLQNVDELHKNIREVFISFLLKDKLLAETNEILKQVESKVNQVFEKLLKRL